MMKKLLSIISLLLILLIGISSVKANTIDYIEMDIYIDKFGNASITEVWNAYLSEGTEGYRTYTNLGNSSISNFIVSDDSGKTYETLPFWSQWNASFDYKSYKSGLHYIPDGVELCWGISNYGNRTYTLKYDVSNFVTQYTDTQGIYFNFLNLDQPVGSARITIRSDKALSLDNARIWSFGYSGTINFVDGKIILDSGGYLSKSQYMVGLVRFETNLFNTSNSLNKSFDEIYNSARWDEIYNYNSEIRDDFSKYEHTRVELEDDSNKRLGLLIVIISIVFVPVCFVLSMVVSKISRFMEKKKEYSDWIWNNGKISSSLDFGIHGRKLPSYDKINYWREIPCNKDLERAYWVAYNYKVVSINILREGVIGAILLKWIKEGLITISKTKKGLFSIKDNNYAIDFSNMQYASNEIENKLFKMLKKASGSNKILEAKEFEKWCKKNYNKIKSWFLSFNTMEQAELERQGLITNEQKQTTGMFGKQRMITVKKVNQQLREEAIQLRGLKKFLLDFSMMSEREYFEVHIWEEYLIYAQLLGIADKVEEQFSKLYPQFNEQTKLNTDITTIAIRNMAYLGYKECKEEITRESTRKSSSSSSYDYSGSYSGSSRDSGGGGISYSSGGKSAGGSSGGGFR